MNKHTDTTRPVDAPTRSPYGDFTNKYRVTPADMLTAAYNDPWTGNPDTDRYWAHNND